MTPAFSPAVPQPTTTAWPGLVEVNFGKGNRWQVLADSFLGRLPDDLRARVGGLGRLDRLDAAEPGESGSRVTVVLEGTVKVFHHGAGGAPLLVDLAGRGDLVEPHGVFAPEDGTSYQGTCHHGWPASVLRIARTRFGEFLSSHPAAMTHLSALMSTQARRWIDRYAVNDLSLAERVYTLLVGWANRHGVPARDGSGGGMLLDVGLTQAEIAATLGVSTVSVERAVRALRNADLLASGYRQFTVYPYTPPSGVNLAATASLSA